MLFTATVTQKGQVTIPKKLRQRYGITTSSTVMMTADVHGIKITPTQDIIDLAGSFIPKKKTSVLGARAAMEKEYRRF